MIDQIRTRFDNAELGVPTMASRCLAIFAPSFILVLSIWLPFGFSLTGLIEEWDVLGLFTTHGLFYVADTTSPLAAHAIRPLTVFPHALAYYFDPDSFNYWNVILMATLLIKGCASSFLTWRATRSLTWAAVMGALLLVYPADTMQLSFRALHINFSLAIFLLASSVFVVAFEQNRTATAYSLAVLAALLFFIACCTYEASVALAPLPLLIIFTREGVQASLRQFRDRLSLITIWMFGAGLYVAYAISTSVKVSSYQTSVVGGNSLTTLVNSLPNLVSIGALRGLLGGWFDAIRMVSTEIDGYGYLLVVVAMVGLVGWLVETRSFRLQTGSPRYGVLSGLPVRLGFSGLILLLLGYSPFLLSPSHQVISQRTFLWASLGAAMIWVSVLIVLASYSRLVAALMALLLIFFGFGAQVFQFHHYVNLSEKQHGVLKRVVENFDGNLGDKTLLLLDESSQLGHTWMLTSGTLSAALSYIYGKPISSIVVCHMPSREWQKSDSLARKGTCIEEKDEWVFRSPGSIAGSDLTHVPGTQDLRVSKSQIVSLSIKPDVRLSLEPALLKHRDDLLKGSSLVGYRYRNILTEKQPFLPVLGFEDQKIQDRYRWSFGDWWSLELPQHGSGWREAEWSVQSFEHVSSAWKTQENASLFFRLPPASSHYALRGYFSAIVSSDIRDSLRISVNGNNVDYRWVSDGGFEAEMPPDYLSKDINKIEFNSKIDSNYYDLSLKLDWFEVEGIGDPLLVRRAQ